MRPVMPFIALEPDDQFIRPMSNSGSIVGYTKSRIIWRFGFMPNSPAAKAYGVSTNGFIWIIATPTGRILDRLDGKYALELPKRYQKIIDSKL